MKSRLVAGIATTLLLSGMVGSAEATVIDFTGGTATLLDSTTATTNTSWVSPWNYVDYYTENGFKLDFIGDGGIIGDYYGGNNDVIHGHWATGDYGSLTEIKVSKLDATSFDLNYFELTSNTDTGGYLASGSELAYIVGYDSIGNAITTMTLLPPDDWGWTGANPQVFLDSTFDNIYSFSVFVGNAVDCFGMDMFYIDEAAPPPHGQVPEPATLLLVGAGLAGLAAQMKRRKQA